MTVETTTTKKDRVCFVVMPISDIEGSEPRQHKFNDMLKRIGLQEFKLHSLRHTFATRLVSAGVDLYAVQRLLGHADIRTSMVYAKMDMETLQRAVEKLKN